MQLNEHVPFFTSIFTAEISVSHLSENVKQLRNNNSVVLSNRGGWHSSTYNGLGGDDSFINPVFEEIDEYMNTIHQMYNLYIKKLSLQNYWYNINNRYDYNISHTHPFSIFSGCVYFKVPENSGNIVFERPDNMVDYFPTKTVNARTFSKYEITPCDNLLVIFPSYLRHSVETNLTNDKDDERITMAFNYR